MCMIFSRFRLDLISSREYSYYFRLKFVEKLKSVLKSMESKIPEKILHIHTDLSLTHIKIPPECHQTSARLPPDFRQTSASVAARIPPDFRQNSTRLPPALPPEFRQTSARMPPEFRQNAASLSSNLLCPAQSLMANLTPACVSVRPFSWPGSFDNFFVV